MDLNIVVLAGRAATVPEIRPLPDGRVYARCLVTVRSEHPRHRLDVVPVHWWDPDLSVIVRIRSGSNLWVAGNVQRRFWDGADGRRSRIEVVAHDIQVADEPPAPRSADPSSASDPSRAD